MDETFSSTWAGRRLYLRLEMKSIAASKSSVDISFCWQAARVSEISFLSNGEFLFLSSATTFVGLVPLMFDNSQQAQFLIPMAVSLAFGVLFATAITLFLIPSVLLVADDFQRLAARLFSWYRQPFRRKGTEASLP